MVWSRERRKVGRVVREVRMGRCQKARVERSVGKKVQLKRWVVVSSDRLQCGQDGEGVW